MKHSPAMLYLWIAALICLLAPIMPAQTTATTSDGKTVILNSDGTWTYQQQAPAAAPDTTDCSAWIKTAEDKVSGKQYTTAKEYLIVANDDRKEGFGFNLMKSSSSKSVIMSIVVAGGSGCVDDGDDINILFRDGTRLTLANMGEFNCEAKSTVYFGVIWGKKKELMELATKEIATMRVWTRREYVERDFTPSESNTLRNSLRCLAETIGVK